ncbi:MAG: ribonuclease J [Candidatus Sumerlaeia bacterium]|nr:ribonuclease J [Candidatus Sumerlaeia bacterium]
MTSKPLLRIVPLGGLGEVGMNMMALECGGDAIVIDCGQRMPEEDTPGIDLIVPDITHLREIRSKIRAIVLTHGHEDHIGALPYLWPDLEVPVCGRRLTLALVREKLREFGLDRRVPLQEVKLGEPVTLGRLCITYVHVTHSISQSSALIIETPAGVVVHSGDYKIDDNPPDGERTDREALARAGARGVLLLLADSTNVDRPGRTPSEAALVPAFERLLAEAKGSTIVGCFASATHRHRLVLDIAQSLGKRVFLAGLSMTKNIRIQRELGLLRVPDELILDVADYRGTPPQRRVVLATGSQGEPLSALSRIALDEHRQITLGEDDQVILSARIIPGNERSIFRMINHFFRRDVAVHHEPAELVHTSGHAYREEMRELINLVRPRYLVPVHGEMRHLIAHRRLAIEEGIPADRVFVLEDGQILECNGDGARRAGDAPAGRVFVDGLGVGDISEVVLRDRKHLAQDGMAVVILAVDRQTRDLAGGPDFISRGFVQCDLNEEVISDLKEVARRAFEALPREAREEAPVVEEEIRRALRRSIKKRFDRRPMILPVVMEV